MICRVARQRCNDDADQSFNSLLEVSLTPGRYFLFVDNFSRGRVHRPSDGELSRSELPQ